MEKYMKSIQDLRDQIATRAKEIKKLMDDNPGDKWKPEHQSLYDSGMSEIELATADVRRLETYHKAVAEAHDQEAIEDHVQKRAKDEKKPDLLLFNKWLRGGDKALNAEDWKIYNTLSTTTGSEGGNTVQADVVARVVDRLKFYGGMRAVSEVFSTSGFGDLNYPTSDGTAEVGELIGQNTTATAADPTFGVVTITAYKYSSKIVAAPYELLQDSNVDIEQFIVNRLATRLGRIQNTHFTTGTGTGQPRGVVTGSTQGRVGTSGQTLTVIFDDLVFLIHALDPAYRYSGQCSFMLNDASFGIVRRLKDSQNRPVFIPGWDGLGQKMQDTLLGYPVVVNQDVPVMAANAKSILFGDFSYYKIRDVMDMRMFRFEDSAYAKLGQVGFLAWMRSGGNLVEAVAVQHYANSAT
jgi:HK97 family phage major capsid protein